MKNKFENNLGENHLTNPWGEDALHMRMTSTNRKCSEGEWHSNEFKFLPSFSV